MQPDTSPEEVRSRVRGEYGRIAEGQAPLGRTSASQVHEIARRFGYAAEQLAQAPEGANLGLGCGNPTALSALAAGETVLDLGCGAGFDSLLAAREVGPSGQVIGVDLAPQMLEKARRNARVVGADNVEYREGAMESLPVADASVDVVLSNCAINLSPQKDRVFAEVARVLRPGGRVVVSDLIAEAPLPEPVVRSVEAYVGCVAGALPRSVYLGVIQNAGLRDVRVHRELGLDTVVGTDHPQVLAVIEESDVEATDDQIVEVLASIRSITVEAWRR